MIADGFIAGFIEAHSGSVNNDTYSALWTNHMGPQLNGLEKSALNEPTFVYAVGELSESWLPNSQSYTLDCFLRRRRLTI